MAGSGYARVSGVVFSIVALAHLWRAVQGLPVQVGEMAVPVSISWVAVVVAGGLAVWAFRGRG